MQTLTRDPHPSTSDPAQLARVEKAIRSKSFATLSTVSAAGFPHAAGVVYATDGHSLWIHTMRSSRKARNVEATGRAGVVIPIRRLPVGPPFTVQFQARAEVIDMDDPRARALIDAGGLKKITGHGELDEPDGCFLRIEPTARIHSFGIGVSAIDVARDPLHAGARTVEI